MSQQKAQLISPIDTFTPPGINVTGAGIVTATSFVGSGGTVTGLAAGANVTAGVVTATTFYGDGSNLDGVAAAGYVGQTTAAQSGTTTIDLSAGNVIYFTQDTDTTVAFASTEAVQELLFIRTKDDTTTARTITWPDSIIWNGGSAPTLIDSNSSDDVQIFNLTTRDQGVTWYGYEAMQSDPADVAEPGALYSWGRNDYGQVGNNTRQGWPGGTSSPVQLPGTSWLITSRGRTRAFSVKSDNTLWAWGENTQGRLGQNSEIHYSSPTQIPGTTWSTISSGYHSSYAIKTDGSLWGWGRASDAGELSQNDRVDRSSPVQIPGTQWTVVSGGEYYASAIKSDGTLWTWGYNLQGQLGLNSRVSYSSPVQIPGTQWSKIDSARYHQMAQKTDGTLWGWGNNGAGPLAQNNRVPYSSPVQISGTAWSDYISSTGSGPTIASKTDGTSWIWGSNSNGQLGLNDMVNRSSPTQLPGTGWVIPDRNSYDSGSPMTVLTKTDGTLWAWGRNYAGGFGINGNIGVNYSSPKQVTGTQWTTVSVYGNSTLAKQNP